MPSILLLCNLLVMFGLVAYGLGDAPARVPDGELRAMALALAADPGPR